jgi:hypothetical protein
MQTLCVAATAQEASLKLTVPAAEQNRRFIVAEYTVPAGKLAAPFALRDAQSGQAVACQTEAGKDGVVVRWVIDSLDAGKSASFVLSHSAEASKDVMQVKEDPKGFLSIVGPDREITRYNFGPDFARFKKPFFYPVNADGVSMTRAWPMEEKAGETHDHPHHTGMYFAYGDVNGKEYWSKLPITHKRFISEVSGPVYARIVAENNWGDDLTEIQDITFYNAGQDVVADWVITMKAEKGPVKIGKTKEGGFSVRVPTGLTTPAPAKGKARPADAPHGTMTDSEGRTGEKQIWSKAAPWVDMSGTVDGKAVGISIMNHPSSFHFPTEWHSRDYGLFAANPFFMQPAFEIKQGDSVTLKFRVYFHAGNADAAKVKDVYAGYAAAKVDAQ